MMIGRTCQQQRGRWWRWPAAPCWTPLSPSSPPPGTGRSSPLHWKQMVFILVIMMLIMMVIMWFWLWWWWCKPPLHLQQVPVDHVTGIVTIKFNDDQMMIRHLGSASSRFSSCSAISASNNSRISRNMSNLANKYQELDQSDGRQKMAPKRFTSAGSSSWRDIFRPEGTKRGQREFVWTTPPSRR